MNGEDRGFVEVLQRLVERQGELSAGRAHALLDCLDEPRDERVTGPGSLAVAGEPGERFDDPRADALPQLRGGRVGEGHDQDLLHV